MLRDGILTMPSNLVVVVQRKQVTKAVGKIYKLSPFLEGFINQVVKERSFFLGIDKVRFADNIRHLGRQIHRVMKITQLINQPDVFGLGAGKNPRVRNRFNLIFL